MTVEELIKELQKYPSNAIALFPILNGYYSTCNQVTLTNSSEIKGYYDEEENLYTHLLGTHRVGESLVIIGQG